MTSLAQPDRFLPSIKSSCHDTVEAHTVVALILVATFTDEQYTTLNQSTAGCFDPRVLVNCLQVHL